MASGGIPLGTCGADAATPSEEAGETADLSGYRTVHTAATTKLRRHDGEGGGQPAYLGVAWTAQPDGRLAVAEVAVDSPAARAPLRSGDILRSADGQPIRTGEALRDWIQSKQPGEAAALEIERDGRTLSLMARLTAVSRPMKVAEQRPLLGVQVGEPNDDRGAPILRVTADSPAAKAGLKAGDLLLQIDDATLTSAASAVSDTLAEKRPGDTVRVTVRRHGQEETHTIKLAAAPSAVPTVPGAGPRGYWRREVYRLAVIGVEYPDQKNHPQIPPADWAEALFSTNRYLNKTNSTGQRVFGSLHDYYQEQSCGALRVEGRVFDPVQASQPRAHHAPALTESSKAAFLTEVLDLLVAREGREALRDFDGLTFIYAGDRFPRANRGSLYWPHRGTVSYGGKRWSYVIVPEGGRTMSSISVLCHEFGHLLGLPDLYARPENPGSEGAGAWCAMSNQRGGGRPQHFSAWCKEQLGWLKPAVIDPTVRQKLILGPVLGSSHECFKVLVRSDGSEYLLLENRRRAGFDQSLPAEGLLIWRVVGNRPFLEESHGVEGALGPRVFLSLVPYPSRANDSFTPYTTPSSRSQLGGGLPVHISQIRRWPDGRISFQIGSEYH